MGDFEVVVHDQRSERTKRVKPLDVDKFEKLMVGVLNSIEDVQDTFVDIDERCDFTKNFLISFVVTFIHNQVQNGYMIEELDDVYKHAKEALLKYEVELDAYRD